MLAAGTFHLAVRAVRCGGAAKVIEPVIGKLLPRRRHLGECEATTIASAHALEAEPASAEVCPNAHMPGRGVDVPHVPFETIAVREDP
jgi:hypothetical protein